MLPRSLQGIVPSVVTERQGTHATHGGRTYMQPVPNITCRERGSAERKRSAPAAPQARLIYY